MVRVAIVGTAHIHSGDYVRACEAVKGVQIVGATGIDRDAPIVLPRTVPVSDTIEALPEHDLCVVTTDILGHRAAVGASSAPHVFVEKPLGVSTQDARDVAALLTRTGQRFHTGFFLRQDPGVAALRDRLVGGAIGAVRHASLVYVHAGASEGWLTDWPAHERLDRMGYTPFSDLAAHLVDLCRWTLGPVTSMACVTGDASDSFRGVDGHAIVRSGKTATAHIRCGATSWHTVLELSFEGDAGTLALRGGVVTQVTAAGTEILFEGDSPTPQAGFETVLRAISNGGDALGATLEDAVAVNETLDELYVLAAVTRRNARD